MNARQILEAYVDGYDPVYFQDHLRTVVKAMLKAIALDEMPLQAEFRQAIENKADELDKQISQGDGIW